MRLLPGYTVRTLLDDYACRVLSVLEQATKLDAEEKSFQLQLAIISGQMVKTAQVNRLSETLRQAASDILEADIKTPTSQLKKIFGSK